MPILESSMDSFVAVDVETTGLNPCTEHIIEIGAVRIRAGRIEEEFQTFVQPKRKLSSFVTELTGITDSMLDGAPDIERALRAFLDFAGQEALLGHNVTFDYSFLKRHMADIGEKFVRNGIDTLSIARKLLPDMEDRSLGALCHYYQIENARAHRAKEDAIAAFKLYCRLKDSYGGSLEVNKLFCPVPLYCRLKKNSPATAAQLRYLKALLACHGLPEMELENLTKSEASRRIDKIILMHGKISNKM